MQHFAAATRARLAGVLLACAALLAAGLQVATVAPAAAATVAAHPYSDPVWFPVHLDPTRVGCVGDRYGDNNGQTAAGQPCATDHQHYWGLNITSLGGVDDNPAVFAAGAGIVLSVDGSEPACGGTQHNGNLVEIDHGGGVVSVYEHLATVSVTRGQEVSPATQIGTMGASGAPCRAGTNQPANAYLDFQVRVDGGGYLTATTTRIRTLLGCAGSAAEASTWPAGLGLAGSPATWSDVPYGTSLDTAGQGNCYPASAGAGSPTQPARPGVRAGNSSARVAWPAVSGADRYLVQTQIYRTDQGWEAPCSPYRTAGCTVGYTAVAATATTAAVTGLDNGRRYRMRLSVHNAAGWSRPSSWALVTPAGPAGAPTFRDLATTSRSVTLYWTMRKNDLNGGALRGFQVAIDVVRGGTAGRWHYTTLSGVDAPRHFRWAARAHTTYRVKVRAVTAVGRGAWMRIHRTTTG